MIEEDRIPLIKVKKRAELVKHIRYFFNRKRDTARAEAGETVSPDPTQFDTYRGPGEGHSGPKVTIRRKKWNII